MLIYYLLINSRLSAHTHKNPPQCNESNCKAFISCHKSKTNIFESKFNDETNQQYYWKSRLGNDMISSIIE